MTGASEYKHLVRLRAQVMQYDEGSGGWVPRHGGGLADVVVGKRPALPPKTTVPGVDGGANDTTSSPAQPSPPVNEYYIRGIRISDNVNVLECTIKKDFMYNKVMPTFHHWVTDDQRFGLTFQTAADARAFDKGVRIAVEEMLDDLRGTWSAIYDCDKHYSVPTEEDEEQNIFECLDLPGESRPHTSSCNGSRSPDMPPSPSEAEALGNRRRDITQTPILSAITLPNHPLSDAILPYDDISPDDSHRYVQLTAIHDYTYPHVHPNTGSSESSSPNTRQVNRDSGSMTRHSYDSSLALAEKIPRKGIQTRLQCRHCDQWYFESTNRAGSCDYAPDCFRSCVDCVSCIKCAQCMLYHCMSDAEGDYASRPCACSPVDHACAKRWSGVALLSLVVPCLWCYMPLRCVHKVACAASIAGGLHAPTNR